MVLEQVHAVAAFNVFDFLTYEKETPRYEYWFEEVFSEGFDRVSNAKGFDQFHSYWSYHDNGGGITARENIWSTRVDCPAPHEVEDPFGSGSIGDSYWDVNITDPSVNSNEPTTLWTTTYIDISEHIPLAAEELIIDNAVTPCVKDMIKKIKEGEFGNDLFVKVLRDIFDTDELVNITITEVPMALDEDGDFDPNAGAAGGDIAMNGELQINSLYTGTASEDWILATLIHEMIHGYISYYRNRLSLDYMTQAEFDRRFPLYIPGTNAEHAVMGNTYVEKIVNILLENNPNLSLYEAQSLSRAGLQGTFYGDNLNDQFKLDSEYYTKVGRGSVAKPAISNQKDC